VLAVISLLASSAMSPTASEQIARVSSLYAKRKPHAKKGTGQISGEVRKGEMAREYTWCKLRVWGREKRDTSSKHAREKRDTSSKRETERRRNGAGIAGASFKFGSREGFLRRKEEEAQGQTSLVKRRAWAPEDKDNRRTSGWPAVSRQTEGMISAGG